MPYSLNYRRPKFVDSDSSVDRAGSISSGSTGRTLSGIPDALSFDRVINGGTVKPCTLRDFMNYLLYIELSAENLQFYLWYQYYCKRFSHLPPNEKVLAQPWTPEKDAMLSPRANRVRKPPQAAVPDIFRGTDFDEDKYISDTEKFRGHVSEGYASDSDQSRARNYSRNFSGSGRSFEQSRPQNQGHDSEKISNPFDDAASPRSPGYISDDVSTVGSVQIDIQKSVAMAFHNADVKFQPFTVQPFREEITRIIATYIADDAPRQLNLASREKQELLQALAQTTHPTAFANVFRTIEHSLRFQAHPNFIRWAICNCNRSRIRFCGCLGATFLIGGLACVVLLTLSHSFRAWRVIAMLPIMIGVAMLFMVHNGVCLVLHVLHHRHLRPWELFMDESANSQELLMNRSMDSFGTVNSYEDEPWVARYHKRFIIRKIFDREEWIQDPTLRRIHDTIFIQALITGAITGCIIVGVFCAVPQMHVI